MRQPEPGAYIVGMKSYGRAPTFLMLTGYEQVRSTACDHEGAREVQLVLPETGVCSSGNVLADRSVTCCAAGVSEDATPATATDACCAPASAEGPRSVQGRATGPLCRGSSS